MTQRIDLTTFTYEVEDLLERIEAALLALEARPDDAELLNQLFRAFHTLKGSSGVVGVTSIASFTHHLESALDLVRNGRLALTPPLVAIVLAAKDHVAALMAELTGAAPCDPTAGAAIIAQLTELTGAGARPAAAPAPRPAAEPTELPAATVDYLVEFRPNLGAEIEVEPGTILIDLQALGTCVRMPEPPATDDRPAPWRYLLSTRADENAIRDVLIFIAGQGELQLNRGLSEFYPDPAPTAAPTSVARTIDAPAPTPAARATAPTAAPGPGRAPTAAKATVRVSSERLDQLVKLIGELVITQSRLQQVHSLHPSPELAGPVESLERLIADLRDGVLGLRMVPIGTMFAKFQRLVHDLSAELGKDVVLVTEGDETELDKNVIDQLADALIHILRNSMDHGIEAPADRIAAGKPGRGTLRLTAAHEGAQVVITIADDGRGIDLAAVRRKAIASGLIGPDTTLSEADTLALITRPGLTTAAAVTQLSGRGVGMDVVKRTIEGLRGALRISSTGGGGTTIRLALPLTLAIIDGLLVEVDRARFIMPMAAVMENLELTRAERHANNGRNVVAVRGELVPYVRLRDTFEMADTDAAIERIVVVAVDGKRVGLVVDRVVGSHQTVIQPLGHFYRGADVFSGTTIMGDGRVAMILDLARTVHRMDGRSDQSFSGARGLS